MADRNEVFNFEFNSVINPTKPAPNTGVAHAGGEYNSAKFHTDKYIYINGYQRGDRYYPAGRTLTRINKQTGEIYIFDLNEAYKDIPAPISGFFQLNGQFFDGDELVDYAIREVSYTDPETGQRKYRQTIYVVIFREDGTTPMYTTELPSLFNGVKWGNTTNSNNRNITAIPYYPSAGFLGFEVTMSTEEGPVNSNYWSINWTKYRLSVGKFGGATATLAVDNASYTLENDLFIGETVGGGFGLQRIMAGNSGKALGPYIITVANALYEHINGELVYLLDGEAAIVSGATSNKIASINITAMNGAKAEPDGMPYPFPKNAAEQLAWGHRFAIITHPTDTGEEVSFAPIGYAGYVNFNLAKIPVRKGTYAYEIEKFVRMDNSYAVYSALRLPDVQWTSQAEISKYSSVTGQKLWSVSTPELYVDASLVADFYEDQERLLVGAQHIWYYINTNNGEIIWTTAGKIDSFGTIKSYNPGIDVRPVGLFGISDGTDNGYKPRFLIEEAYPKDNTSVRPYEWADLGYTVAAPELQQLNVGFTSTEKVETYEISEYEWPASFGPWPGGTSIQVPSVRLRLHTKGQYSVSAQYSDGSNFDISTDAAVVLSDSTIVTLQGNELTGIKTGITLLQASYDGVSAYGLVEVYGPESLEVVPDQLSIRIARRTPLKAFAIYADGFQEDCTLQASWLSDSPQYVNVVAPGLVEGLQRGYGSLTVSYGDAFVPVSVDIIDIDAPYIMNVDAESATLYVYFKLTETLPEPTYFRTDVYSDNEQNNRLASTNLVENPESFKVTVDNGISWHPVNADGIIPSPDNVEIFMSEIYIGPKTRVWTTVSAALISATEEIPEDTDPPIMGISPATASYKESITVEVTTNKRANVYYTLDGSTPSTSSSIYKGPVTIETSKTFKAIAVDMAGRASEVQERLYVIDKLAPILSLNLEEGNYLEGTKLLIVASEEATIKYTNMDMDPVDFGEIYEGPIELTSSGTYRFVAIDKAGNVSAEVVRSFVIIPEGGTEEYRVETPVETEVTYRLTPEYPVKHVLLTGLTIGTEYVVEFSEGSDLYVEDDQVRLMAAMGTYTFIAQQETHSIRIKSRVPITQDTVFNAITKAREITHKGDDILNITNLLAGQTYRLLATGVADGTLTIFNKAGEEIAVSTTTPPVVDFEPTETSVTALSDLALDVSSGPDEIKFILSRVLEANPGSAVTLDNLAIGKEYVIQASTTVEGTLYVEDGQGATIVKATGTPPAVSFKATEQVVQFRFDSTVDMLESDVTVEVEVREIIYANEGSTFENAVQIAANGSFMPGSVTMERERMHYRVTGLEVGTEYSADVFIIEGTNLGVDSVVTMYNEAKEEVTSDDDGGMQSRMSSLTFTATEPTAYFVVTDYSYSGEESDFYPSQLRVGAPLKGFEFETPLEIAFVEDAPIKVDAEFNLDNSEKYVKITGLTPGQDYLVTKLSNTVADGITVYDGDYNQLQRINSTYDSVNAIITAVGDFIVVSVYNDAMFDSPFTQQTTFSLKAAEALTEGTEENPFILSYNEEGVYQLDFVNAHSYNMHFSIPDMPAGSYKVSVPATENSTSIQFSDTSSTDYEAREVYTVLATDGLSFQMYNNDTMYPALEHSVTIQIEPGEKPPIPGDEPPVEYSIANMNPFTLTIPTSVDHKGFPVIVNDLTAVQLYKLSIPASAEDAKEKYVRVQSGDKIITYTTSPNNKNAYDLFFKPMDSSVLLTIFSETARSGLREETIELSLVAYTPE